MSEEKEEIGFSYMLDGDYPETKGLTIRVSRCPFCGAFPALEATPITGVGLPGGYYRIFCDGDDCGEVAFQEKAIHRNERSAPDAMAKLERRWNQRKP